MPSMTGRDMLKHEDEIGLDHRVPLLDVMRCIVRVAGDAGIVDQHLDRAELGLDLGDRRPAHAWKSRDVELEDRDAGLAGELLGAASSLP